jgi:general secretion pathway protein G
VIRTALDRYYLDNGYYPPSDQGLASLVSAPSSGRKPPNYEEGGYIEGLPDDPWGPRTSIRATATPTC